MNKIFTTLILLCLSFSFNKGFAQTKPILTYTVVAYIEEQTANYFGGKAAIQDSITKQFQRINAIFNANASFNNTYNFSPVAFNYFKDNANEDSTFAIEAKPAETNYKYRMVYNAFPNSSNEYVSFFSDQSQSVVLSYSETISINGSMFGRIMTKTLAHEFGHARGAYDLYAGNINANQNLVNSNLGWNNPVNSIMNGLFTENSFDTYSTYMINKTASLYGSNNFTPEQWRTITVAAFPQTVGVSVAAGNGFPIPNATVKFYAVPWFPDANFTLSTTPTYTLTTDNGGLAKFTGTAANPFGISTGSIQYHTLFVTVTYNNETKYAWIPFHEVCSAYAAGQTSYYKNVFVNAINYNIPPMINVGTSGPLIANAPLSTVFPIYAYDLDGSISSVKVYKNGVFEGNANIDPSSKVYWYYTPALAAGNYSYTVIATDNAGATVTSSVLKVDVNPANLLPSVSLSAPSNNATYTAPASISISGNASDSDGSISKIQLYASGNLLATYTATSSFSYSWTSVAQGDYTISARVTDNKGGVSISTVSVKVNAASTCTAPAWNSTTAYVGGNVVVYSGIKYQANWWNYNERPDLRYGEPGSGEPWTRLGTCTNRLAAVNESNAIGIYPNPAQEIVNVRFQSASTGNVEIFVSDMVDYKVLSTEMSATEGSNDVRLDVSSLQSGMYILSISNGNDKLVKQLVINK